MGEIWSTCIMAPLCGCRCSSASSNSMYSKFSTKAKGSAQPLCPTLHSGFKIVQKIKQNQIQLTKIRFSIILEKKFGQVPEKQGHLPPRKNAVWLRMKSATQETLIHIKNNICKTIGYKITVIQRVSFSTSLQVIDLMRHPKVSAYQISFFRQCTISYSMAKKCKFTSSIQDQNQKFSNKKNQLQHRFSLCVQSLR